MTLVEQIELASDTLASSAWLPAEHPAADRPSTLRIADRTLHPTPVFDTYWRFAAERQAVYEARLAGQAGPWTADPILQRHRFTNCFRAADRVSQFLIRSVAYTGDQAPEEIAFRVLLFKMFNKVSTWQLLCREVGQPSWSGFDEQAYDQVLSDAFARRERLYSAAYVIPPPRLGGARKHTNHVRLIRLMMETGIADRLLDSGSLQEAFRLLLSYPALGDFLAYQFVIDLNYSAALNFDEMDFVVAGPGARDGIRKCFGREASGIEADVIAYMAEHQKEHFDRLGLTFEGLRGRQLQLIDCQNLFCEVDKYARVAHPDVCGISGRTRIKQKYAVNAAPPLTAWFPPKWNLN